ncbi:hypothetical protein D3C83_130630 [compost metagenome]
MLPGTLTATVFGDQIQTGLRNPERINYWIVAAVVLAMAVAIMAVRRWLYRTQLREHHPARGSRDTVRHANP